MVGGADEWPRLYVAKAHAKRLVLHELEFLGRVVACHGQVVARGAKILADGEYVNTDSGKIAIDVKKLVHLFAEANHHSGLGDDGGVKLLRKFEQAQGPLIARSGTDGAVEARD